MDYQRKDSNAKAKSGKEPQVLHPTMTAGKPSKLSATQQKNIKRKEALMRAMGVYKDSDV
jgi:hypothetical protein